MYDQFSEVNTTKHTIYFQLHVQSERVFPLDGMIVLPQFGNDSSNMTTRTVYGKWLKWYIDGREIFRFYLNTGWLLMRITEEQGSYPGYAFYFRYKKPMNDQTNKPDWKVKITSNELSAEVSKDEIVYHGTNHTPAQFLSAINNRRKVYECWKKNFQK